MIESKTVNSKTNYTTISEYIATFPQDVQTKLNEIRQIIKTSSPSAQETIAYGIPTYKLNGKNLLHFGGYKKHIGFYPAPRGIQAFKKELKNYLGGRGTVRFPLDKPLPATLIAKIVKFRTQENLNYQK